MLRLCPFQSNYMSKTFTKTSPTCNSICSIKHLIGQIRWNLHISLSLFRYGKYFILMLLLLPNFSLVAMTFEYLVLSLSSSVKIFLDKYLLLQLNSCLDKFYNAKLMNLNGICQFELNRLGMPNCLLVKYKY